MANPPITALATTVAPTSPRWAPRCPERTHAPIGSTAADLAAGTTHPRMAPRGRRLRPEPHVRTGDGPMRGSTPDTGLVTRPEPAKMRCGRVQATHNPHAARDVRDAENIPADRPGAPSAL